MAVNGYIVGLTGGIGSGKSTVADLFSMAGVGLVDTDSIAHALTAGDGYAMAEIRKRMGEQFIAPDGSLDRAATRRRIFVDPAVKLQLEAILHPLIHEEVEKALRSDAMQQAPYSILVVPLLFETLAYRDRTHQTLLIDCPVGTQLARVKRRSGLSADEPARIVDAQLPRAVRLQLADDIISNNASTDALWPQVEPLHLSYVQNAKSLR